MEDLARALKPPAAAHPGGGPSARHAAVAVIGGGYAGMAAAVELADAGLAVTVFESAPELGGRARRVHYRDTVLDNGLHVGIGAYRSLLELGARVRPAAPGHDAPAGRRVDAPAALEAARTGWHRLPLDWRVEDRIHLRAPRWPAPWHLLAALAGARGLPIAARWDAIRLIAGLRRSGYRIAGDPTLAAWLHSRRQGEAIVRALWAPLCLAALNTPVAEASAQVFANVLRDSLGADRAASDLLLPATDLTALFPAPAAVHVQSRGGNVLCGTRVDRIERLAAADAGGDGGLPGAGHPAYRLACSRPGGPADARFDALVLAVAPRALAGLVAGWPELEPVHRCVSGYAYEPITSIYLQYPPAVALAQPMIGFADGAGQWAFDRGALAGQAGLLGVVISASAAQRSLDAESLAREVHAQLERLQPGLPPALWHKVITEKFATFACTPGLARPGTATAAPGVFLAGDHVAGDYPATLESAVRSGQQAAHALVDYLRGRR